MKLCIVIQNDQWRQSAGVRIRYNRLRQALVALGHSLETRIIDDFKAGTLLTEDIYIFSKCHDVRTLLLLRMLRKNGRLTGVDFFDDYYSQASDSRFLQFREWFRNAIPLLDMALCSTPGMRRVIDSLAPDLSCHILNDPAHQFDPEALAAPLVAKAKFARESRILRIGWFGIGDNPHFRLGISDLSNFSPMFSQMQRAGYSPELRILTNRRALTTERLEMLARLPVPHQLEEWSVEAERALIEDSFICFLPVNAQGFSIVKSLNRGITVLTSGAQILSAGFPLYDRLSSFVYRDVDNLITNLENDKLKLSSKTLPKLTELMTKLADAETEADNLLAFLNRIHSRKVSVPKPSDKLAAVIHGFSSTALIHKFTQRQKVLSIATVISPPGLHYDVIPLPATDRDNECNTTRRISLSPKAQKHLRPELIFQTTPENKSRGPHLFHQLTLPNDAVPTLPPFTNYNRANGLAALSLTHSKIMCSTAELTTWLFGETNIFYSEPHTPLLVPDLNMLKINKKSACA